MENAKGQKIIPHLWFNNTAKEAAEFYTSVFDDATIHFVNTIKDTPSGDCDIVSFRVMGFEFMSISAGPYFTINPSISFHVRCTTTQEVDTLWEKLSPDGKIMMELGEYPFSKRYGWIQDKYGVSWQVIHTEGEFTQRIVPALMFTKNICGKAEEAMHFYASIFPGSSVQVLARYTGNEGPDKEGTIMYAQFILANQEFGAMDSAQSHEFIFNEGVSLMVSCKDQAEIDHYWQNLSAVPEAEQCGWLKDKFGVSWQIVPMNMEELMAKNPAKTTPTMLKMKKIIIADLEKAGDE